MKVFISWSGTRSRDTAKLLYDWLPQIINEVDPWMSDLDIASGGDWSDEIKKHLNAARFGIICVTPGNMKREWLLFEAGALSRQVNDSVSRVAPFLIGFTEKSELRYPLARFQATEPKYEDMKKLLLSLNSQCEKPREEVQIAKALEVFWPSFERPFIEIQERVVSQPSHRRSERDLLQEILGLVRTMEQRNVDPEPPSSGAPGPNAPGTYQRMRGSNATSGAFAAVTALGTMAGLYSQLQRLQFAFKGSAPDPTEESLIVLFVADLAEGEDLVMRLDLLEAMLRSANLDGRVELVDAANE